MIAIKIKNTKKFMTVLLASEVFDRFLLESAELQTANTYTIDGHLNKDFFGEEESDQPSHDLSEWKSIRPVCYELIKGKHTPLGFKFLMCISPEEKDKLLEEEISRNISSLVFILRFRDGAITLTTGAALSGFILDKSYEKIWDDYLRKFLDDANIEYEEL